MSDDRDAFIAWGTRFFTVNLLERHRNDVLVREGELLRESVRRVRARYPFQSNAWVALPVHRYGVWTLPPDDADLGMRWRLIKSFSRALPKTERLSDARKAAGERGVSPRDYLKYLIRDEASFSGAWITSM